MSGAGPRPTSRVDGLTIEGRDQGHVDQPAELRLLVPDALPMLNFLGPERSRTEWR